MKVKYPIGIITNINAKRIRKIKIKPESIVSILGKNNCISRTTTSLEELKKVVEEFKDLGIEVILSNGGDGTHQKLISTLIYNFREYSPVIVPLKSGTMNMLLKNLSLNQTPYNIARWLKNSITNGKDIKVISKPLICIESDAIDKKMYGFVFLAGCAYKILKLYYSYPEGGKRSAAKSIFSTMTGWLKKDPKALDIYTYTPSKFKIDNKKLEFPYLITLASTLDKLIMGFSPFGTKIMKKDKFSIMIDGEPMSKNYTPFKFFKIDDKEEWKAKRIVTETKELTLNVSGGFSLDGEIVNLKEGSSVKLTLGPRINFLTYDMEN